MLAEFGFPKLDEVGDVPQDGYVAGHGKFRAGEKGFKLAEEGRVRLRSEQSLRIIDSRSSSFIILPSSFAPVVLVWGRAFRSQFAARIWRASSSLPSMMNTKSQYLTIVHD